jgi:hypothetical protein
MIRQILFLSLTAAVALGVTAALAQPPLDGTYKSSAGDFLEGRSSTSWITPVNDPPQAGNMLHGQSWDGAALVAEWNVSCPVTVGVLLLFDAVVGGNGHRGYLITYIGGTIWLDGAGPWGGGDASYSGVIDSYTETRTEQYSGGNLVGANSNHSVSAHIVGYPADCVAFGIGNGVLIGDTDPNLIPITDTNVKPADYPDFLVNCAVDNLSDGHWGDLTDLTLTVRGCEVPVEKTSWGAVKSIYR